MREHNLRAALLAGLSLTVLANIQPATARNDFWQPFFRDTPYRSPSPAVDTERSEAKKKAKKQTDTAGEKKAAERAATIPSGPLHIIVSIDKQRVTLFADGKPFANAPISTGTASHPTPTGIFSIIQKNKHHVSNLYDAPMPYMQRITWSGVAMHTGPLPGYAASHGCVRLPNEFAQMLWKATKIGARVVIAKPEVTVTEIEHPNLFVRSMKMAQKSASLSIAEVQQAMAQAVPPHITPQIPAVETAAPRPVAPVRLASGGKLVPGAIISDSVQPVGSIGMVYRPEEEAARLAAAEETKTEEPAVEVTAAVEPEKTTEAKPVVVAEPAKPAEPVKVAEPVAAVEPVKPAEPVKVAEPVQPVEPAKPVEITTSIQIIKDEPGVKKPEIAKAPEPAKPAVIASPTPIKPAIEERAAAVEVMPTAKPVAKAAPVSVFISRKDAKLYVRQGMEPVFDTPVTIKDADKPIGTHVYTAMNLKDDGSSMRWTVVSIPSAYPRDAKSEKNEKTDKKATKHDKPAKAAPVVHAPEPSAKEALDRLDIAPDTLARIEAMMMPGSSLTVSDNKLSSETGKGTDFIVLTP